MSLTPENQLKLIIESMSDGVYMTDGKGICIASNTAFKKITGIKEDVVGKHVTYLLNHNIISTAVTPETISTKNRIVKIIRYPSGCEALVTGNPVLDEKGNLLAVVCIVRDLTELNALKNELKSANKLAKHYIETLKNLNGPLRNVILDKFVVRDPKMERVLNLVRQVAVSDATVIIYGESGVGKGMIAELIHEQSPRAQTGKLVKLDCGAIPPNLLESELFGYERGSFTGAHPEGRIGIFELANKGTLFLDEVAEIPLSLQPKLLNVIQDRVISRIGGRRPIPIDIRIICATNRDLESMVSEGSFRSDLFFRLNVVPITVPPLRMRKEDILIITVSCLERFSQKYNRVVSISPEVIDCFLEYEWPGNVRELENIMERLVLLSENGLIKVQDLPEKITSHTSKRNGKSPPDYKDDLELKKAVAATEIKVIQRALFNNRTLSSAAKELGVDISTLLRKCRRYGIKRQIT